ncbi:tRNA (5-methylaminomethyl-2-thiouridine)(34)-methyltransferase MnmD [Polycladidibacter hongkongensis]|uniref:tRNA (5-methylaminomethyl-2-thiouridine)(34)-methyltransferase MnmD n=1 Tax=Polycladidibacter hongkongensis TaxID=1647556 RepID=UPI00082CE103|nr:tRNA (5-methylaminomethyl-2-thiouridine)(34)-methyltransferase MnmD [Pseudovibrio hongkongensis]
MTEQPKLEWIDADVPFSSHFGDTYYSKAGGLDETSYVFLDGNNLPARFALGGELTIAELGFGTGLNFLRTVQMLHEVPEEKRARLRFVSFELYPMSAEQIRKALAPWPQLASLMEEMLHTWNPQAGWNTLNVGGAELVLGVGDANELMQVGESNPLEDCSVDAWYLDGFNPANNPELWGESLLGRVFALTGHGGSFATYTAAGWVRRNLQGVGFVVERRKGYGTKREMLSGTKP